MIVCVAAIALAVLGNPVPVPLTGVEYEPSCKDSELSEVMEVVYREFIEDDTRRRGPACYFLACAGGTTGAYTDPADAFLERFQDTGASVHPYSTWSSSDVNSANTNRGDGSNPATRHVSCAVMRINWYEGEEGLAILETRGACPDTSLFAVGLAKNKRGEWVAGVF